MRELCAKLLKIAEGNLLPRTGAGAALVDLAALCLAGALYLVSLTSRPAIYATVVVIMIPLVVWPRLVRDMLCRIADRI